MAGTRAPARGSGAVVAGQQQRAAVLAYVDVFWIMGWACVIAIVFVFFAKKTKPGRAAMGH